MVDKIDKALPNVDPEGITKPVSMSVIDKALSSSESKIVW